MPCSVRKWLSLLQNLLIKDTRPAKSASSIIMLYIWVLYLAINSVASIIGVIIESQAKDIISIEDLIIHLGSLFLFIIILCFSPRLIKTSENFKEVIGVIIIFSQIFFIDEKVFRETNKNVIFMTGYGVISFSASTIFYDCVTQLSKVLVYHSMIFLYSIINYHLRTGIGSSLDIRSELNLMVFLFIINIINGYYFFRLRYSHLCKTLIYEKTLHSWKKLMDIIGIGISIEQQQSIKYRNQKFMDIISKCTSESNKYISTQDILSKACCSPQNNNFIIVQDVVYYESAPSSVYIVRDVSDIQKAEREKYTQLLIATITHELRTPLNIIMAILGLLLESAKNFHEDISKALCAASIQETLINDILDMTKLSNGELMLNVQPTEITNFLKSIYELFKFKISESIKFEMSIDPIVPYTIMIDERRYRQILFNLLSNSSKFTKTGEITIGVKYDKGMLYTSVKDTGIGIEQKNYNKIFRQFGMLEDPMNLNKSGTGLGLNLCESLVHKMGGEISFISKYNVGSIFTFSIKADLSSVKPQTKKAWPIEVKLVIVDDNIMNIEVLKSFAKKANLRFNTYSDSEAAKNELLLENEMYVGFFDLNMPKINGYDLAKIIRTSNKKCLLIAVTGEDLQRVYSKCKESGFDSVIEKPVSYKKFCDCLN